jgi:hypothetical protein
MHFGQGITYKNGGNIMKRRISYVLSSALLASLALSGTAVAQSSGGTPSLTSTTVLKDRDEVIWDMAFLPDGAMFFTERCGGLSVRLASGTVIPLLGSKTPRTTLRPRLISSVAGRPA